MSTHTPVKRLSVYIDGFNLYHAINELGDAKLKWLNLFSLGKSLLRDGEELAKVQYFTAIVDWNIHKRMRHTDYIKAQKAKGVVVTEGNFKLGDKHCSKFRCFCPFHEEKQTDVSIGVHMVADAFSGDYTRAVLITADTDQIPTIQMVQTRFPAIELTWLAPPGRMQQAREIGDLVVDRSELSAGAIGTHRLPNIVKDANGQLVCLCPDDYK
jgi:uncharacterized LabA/DUF88 family protein